MQAQAQTEMQRLQQKLQRREVQTGSQMVGQAEQKQQLTSDHCSHRASRDQADRSCVHQAEQPTLQQPVHLLPIKRGRVEKLQIDSVPKLLAQYSKRTGPQQRDMFERHEL
jgi:hypothetical protein